MKQYHINAFKSELKNQLQSTTEKLRLYQKIKDIFCYENYLELPKKSLIKFRINNHQLWIETGRFNLPPAYQSTNDTFLPVRIRLKMNYTFCLTVIAIMIYKNVIIWFHNFSLSTPISFHYLIMRNWYLLQLHPQYKWLLCQLYVLCSFVAKSF